MPIITFQPTVTDAELISISNTHKYKETVPFTDLDGNLMQVPNPQSREDFAMKILEEKWLRILEHELTFPVTDTKSPIDFAKLKEQTFNDLKANSLISI